MTSFFKANAFVVLATTAIHLASCTTPDTLEQDTTNTLVIVQLMQGEDGTEIFSDVCVLTDDEVTGELFCSIFNDNGIVDMTAVLKNQDQLTPTFLNDVTFTSYRVTFTRADGRNTPGVDVPYPFDGAMTFLVPVNGDVSQAFVLVRHQAKLEPPLANLVGSGGSLFISALAEIEFFGRDGAGRAISAKGFMNVHFGDFADN